MTIGFFVVSFTTMSDFTPERIRVLGVKKDLSYNIYSAVPKQIEALRQQVDYNDTRAMKLRAFLESYNAPAGMLDAVPDFIAAADAYNLPWTLLPAISCKESGCGRIIPVDSFNPFGWAVYTGQKTGMNFSSFSESVWHVAEKMRKNYFDQGLDTLAEIERRYTPPSANSHQGWQKDVGYFMNKIDQWAL